MADYRGNLEALLDAFRQRIPQVGKVAAALTHDDGAPAPFRTEEIVVPAAYAVDATGANKVPTYIWGATVDFIYDAGEYLVLCYEQPNPGGAATVETRLYAGQSISFPRGASKVFLRASIPTTVVVTWWTDRFSYKRNAGVPEIAAAVMRATEAGAIRATEAGVIRQIE